MAINPVLIQELESLPTNRQVDVLAFVRFLKYSLLDEETLGRNFLEALDKAQAVAEKQGITEQDIEEEIRAARAGR
jgi:hypothetical protein